MARSKKKQRPKKTAQELEALTSEQVIKHIFGKEGHKALKEQVATHDQRKKSDYRLPE